MDPEKPQPVDALTKSPNVVEPATDNSMVPTTPVPVIPESVISETEPPVVSQPDVAVEAVQPSTIAAESEGATGEQIQHAMRGRIIKIIVALTVVSILGVLLIFFLSQLSDNTLDATIRAENTQATYLVPEAWQESTEEQGTSYVNGDSAITSQANLVIITPTKANFNSAALTEGEITALLRNYEAVIDGSDSDLSLFNRREVEVSGFNMAFDYDIEGVASDEVTQIRGVSRILFDDQNFIHTVEFIAVQNYWDANQPKILEIVDAYALKSQ